MKTSVAWSGTDSDSRGGHLTITGITGDITLDGAISLDATDAGDSHDGRLRLASDGMIMLNSGLDCDKFKLPSSGYVFNAGSGDVFILGELANVDTDNATVNQLSAPAGVTVWYYPHFHPSAPVSANQYLFDNDVHDDRMDGAWTLAGGGRLRPVLPHGTVVIFR